jgi:HPt (histidine-containing phosphotransfer) domain-containing protein
MDPDEALEGEGEVGLENKDQQRSAAVVVDTVALDRLRELGGDHFVVEMIEALLSFAPRVLLEARTALMEGRVEPVGRMGHSLKSSARILGAEAMRDIAIRVEVCAREGTAVALPGLLDEMDHAYSQVKEYLLKVRDNGGKPL